MRGMIRASRRLRSTSGKPADPRPQSKHVKRQEVRPLAPKQQIKTGCPVRTQTDDLAIQHGAVRADRVRDLFVSGTANS